MSQPKQQKGESWADMVLAPKSAPVASRDTAQPKPAAAETIATRAAEPVTRRKQEKKKPLSLDDLNRFRNDCELLMTTLEELDSKIEACIEEKNRLVSVSAKDNLKTYIENSADSAIALLLDTVRRTTTRLQPTEPTPSRRRHHDREESNRLVVDSDDVDDQLDTTAVIIPPPKKEKVAASAQESRSADGVVKSSPVFENNDFTPRWKFMFSHPTENEADPLAKVTTNSDHLAELRNCSSLYNVLRGFGTNPVSFVATEKKYYEPVVAATYVLPSWFVFMYFKYMFTLYGVNDSFYDFGTAKCRKCDKYHRMRRLETFCRKLESLGYASHYRLKEDDEKEDFYRSVEKLVETEDKQSFMKVRHYLKGMWKSESVPSECDAIWINFMNTISESVGCL